MRISKHVVTDSLFLIQPVSFTMLRVLSRGKGKGCGRRASMTFNAIAAGNTAGQRASTTQACGRTQVSKRTCKDQTVQTDVPPTKRTTQRTTSTTEKSQPLALTEADIPWIVNIVKKELSEFLASTQISDTLPTDQEQEDKFDFSGEYYISLVVPFLAYLIAIMNFIKSWHVHVCLAL